jgi:predicted nucleotide-binding protein (sugar kinase/HSP70/actin superfamily)
MRVGIPRALYYYRDFLPWRAFFEALGAEVVISPPATRVTLEAGSRYTVPEACLPLKVFCGHVRALMGCCDMLLVPSVQRYAPRSTNCAKLIGLPDMLKAVMPDLPPLIAPDIDLAEGPRGLLRLAFEAGRPLTLNPKRIHGAARRAATAISDMRRAFCAGELSPADFVSDSGPSTPGRERAFPDPDLGVAVIGHPYNLYDSFVNHSLLDRLRRMGVEVFTPERLGPEPGQDYWTFEYELVGAAQLAVTEGRPTAIEGLIAVLAFGCGPDAVVLSRVQEIAEEAGVPLMALALDEHGGEAGLVTRLEAYVDMLRWRRRRRG